MRGRALRVRGSPTRPVAGHEAYSQRCACRRAGWALQGAARGAHLEGPRRSHQQVAGLKNTAEVRMQARILGAARRGQGAAP